MPLIPISDETVRDYQKSMKANYGVDYSYEESREAFSNLVGLFQVLIKINSRIKIVPFAIDTRFDE